MDLAWIERAARRESRSLSRADHEVLSSLARALAEHPQSGWGDVRAAAAAIAAVQAAGKWIEQERHYSG
jgi:hypothetical protein